MIISYCDKIGEIVLIADADGVSFADGCAYFTESGTQIAYVIPVTSLRRII